MKLCLGTVQLGMEYGIAKDSRPSFPEAINILNYAFSNGITTFDTASGYGNAEEILGEFLKNHQFERKQLHIITKAGNCLDKTVQNRYVDTLKENLSKSLTRLHTDYIDTYLFHIPSYAFDYEKLNALYILKKEGIIKHCGVSVYQPEEALSAIKSGFVDFIQLPFNLFDHRFYNEKIFTLAKKNNIILHTRSVFLQGLFSMKFANFPSFLEIAKEPVFELEKICTEYSLTKLELAMAFVKSFPEINCIVIGVNTLEQLKNNLQIYQKNISKKLSELILQQFNNLNEKIYLPTLWKYGNKEINMNNQNTKALKDKAVKLIPGMTQLLSKRPDRFGREIWPTYFKEAKGISITDLDDNVYFDFSIGGIGATVLGYADEDVNKAVIDVINKGSASTLNSPEEVELAEKLIELHPWAEMARFARSGGEAMSIAVRIARTATGKDRVVFCGYHGWTDWYIAANLGKKEALDDHWISGLNPNGIPKGLKDTAIPFRYNNIEDFKNAIAKAGDDLAAIVMEPVRNFEPTQEFVAAIHNTAKEKNIPLIIDEISFGFRICNGGAHLKLGFHPDIAVFSKALGNGFPISAIIGKEWVMKSAQEAFITSTNWTEKTGYAAALAMINKFVKNDVSKHLLYIADLIWSGWENLSTKYALNMHVGGFKPMVHFNFPENHFLYTTYFTQEMLKKGFLAGSGFYAMYAHTDDTVKQYLSACEEVFTQLKQHIEKNDVQEQLQSQIAQSGFGRIN